MIYDGHATVLQQKHRYKKNNSMSANNMLASFIKMQNWKYYCQLCPSFPLIVSFPAIICIIGEHVFFRVTKNYVLLWQV